MDYTLESFVEAGAILQKLEMDYYRAGGDGGSFIACFLHNAHSYVRRSTREFLAS